MENAYNRCLLCPRACGVNRNSGETGFCGETHELKLAWAGLHFGEEPPITGTGGSGTVFVTGCNLGCSFCQNHQISRGAMGTVVNEEAFYAICCALRDSGAENINIVTGSHAIPALASYIRKARERGFTLPFLWNSSGYETVEALRLLDGCIDRWLPDLKTLNPSVSGRFFQAEDYPATVKQALVHMADQAASSLNQPAMIVRHLVLPGYMKETEDVLRWFSENLNGKAVLSLMTQYTPVATDNQDAETPSRYVSEGEYDSLAVMLDRFDIDEGFFQELVQDDSWLPDFGCRQPFSSSLAKPVWHWKHGFLNGISSD